MKCFEAGIWGGVEDKQRRVAGGCFAKSIKVGKGRQESDDEAQ